MLSVENFFGGMLIAYFLDFPIYALYSSPTFHLLGIITYSFITGGIIDALIEAYRLRKFLKGFSTVCGMITMVVLLHKN